MSIQHINKLYIPFLLAILVKIFALDILQSQAVESDSKQTVERLVELFSTWNGSPEDHASLNEASHYIDYQEMCKSALGLKNWNSLTTSQQKEFISSFRTLVERRYYPRWHKIFHKSDITYLNEIASKNTNSVITKISLGDSQEDAKWDLRKEPSGYRLVNLTVDGKDLVTKANRRFQKRFEKSGYKTFMDWLDTQIQKTSSEDE